MPLNPKVAQLLDSIARSKFAPLHTLAPDAARASYLRSAPILDLPPAPLAHVEDIEIRVRDGASIRVRLYQPFEPDWTRPAPALLFLHGGGFVVGNLETHDALCRIFARDAQCMVVSVDYRLAPEHKFPTAVHDAFDALQWLNANALTYGIDAKRIAIGGDSAGGTLATVAAVMARDAGLRLVLQLLIYPGVGAHASTPSHAAYADGYFLSGKTIDWMFSQYVHNRAERDDWRFAPLDGTRNAPASFAGLAPAWIAAAEYDPLFDEDLAYAAKLRDAGNAVTVRIYEGMVHEFFKMGRFIPEVAHAHADACAALRQAFDTD
ncbi:alpha/beta hydrolase [Pararobbsia silviterrae]|uniref:Alpha/beta hydrolase n=1 Tax=Pararobbsia silviterrae TaxID=1792498 RepID=A0A494X898_9BURK|nr:alpha/beta hydrolase [Pararobbsia silviterrae]RKP44239.1 alpha/beta hydrolase [Pararobbsia silviterrae]